MKTQLLSAAVLFLGLSSSALAAETWEIDASHSGAEFAVRHLMISDVKGNFSGVAGKLQLDPKDVSKSSVEATVDARTVDTNDEKRDAHLKTEDFFWVEKHPTLSFKSTRFQKAGKNKYKVTGDLTMRGATHPVTFDVTATEPITDPWGQKKIGATATTTLNRQQWGISWNKALDKGGHLVGDEVKLTLNLELQPAKNTTAEAAPAAK